MNKTVSSIGKLKEVVRTIISEARGLTFLPTSSVKFENIKRVNNNYEISGIYEYKAIFTGDIIESGKFKIVLDENLEIISLEISPITERSK